MGKAAKAGCWEFQSQLGPLLLMLSEDSRLPWYLVSVEAVARVINTPQKQKQNYSQTNHNEG